MSESSRMTDSGQRWSDADKKGPSINQSHWSLIISSESERHKLIFIPGLSPPALSLREQLRIPVSPRVQIRQLSKRSTFRSIPGILLNSFIGDNGLICGLDSVCSVHVCGVCVRSVCCSLLAVDLRVEKSFPIELTDEVSTCGWCETSFFTRL